jgi:hypothetical protein
MAMATVDIDELLEKQTARVVELTKLAEKVGETKGKLDALDDRVAHNCARNEQNFRDVRDDIDTVNNHLLEYTKSNDDVLSSLKVKNAIKLAVIVGFVLVGVVSFLGGNIFRWEVIDNFFKRTTVQERGEMVKQGIETGAEALSKLK